jgi:chorismate mutase
MMYALRGAISVSRDDAAEIEAAGGQLVQELLSRNAITPADVLSALFTSTPDLTAAFPATGARRAGFQAVPMLCAQEIPVPTAPRRIIRVMLHVNGAPSGPAQHVYLGDAAALRPDLVAESRST